MGSSVKVDPAGAMINGVPLQEYLERQRDKALSEEAKEAFSQDSSFSEVAKAARRARKPRLVIGWPKHDAKPGPVYTVDPVTGEKKEVLPENKRSDRMSMEKGVYPRRRLFAEEALVVLKEVPKVPLRASDLAKKVSERFGDYPSRLGFRKGLKELAAQRLIQLSIYDLKSRSHIPLDEFGEENIGTRPLYACFDPEKLEVSQEEINEIVSRVLPAIAGEESLSQAIAESGENDVEVEQEKAEPTDDTEDKQENLSEDLPTEEALLPERETCNEVAIQEIPQRLRGQDLLGGLVLWGRANGVKSITFTLEI